jgi:GntR family transcriptional regulator
VSDPGPDSGLDVGFLADDRPSQVVRALTADYPRRACPDLAGVQQARYTAPYMPPRELAAVFGRPPCRGFALVLAKTHESSLEQLGAVDSYRNVCAGQHSFRVIFMVDPGSPVLAYVQLANDLARRIDTGELTGRLSAERDLASEYGVAYGTVRRAMEVLRERGLVESVHGRGTFVREH